jgi:hypothetical protein
MIEATGAELWYLPPYSPDLNPIELMWSKVKAILRAIKARAEKDLQDAIAKALGMASESDATGWFRHCGGKPAWGNVGQNKKCHACRRRTTYPLDERGQGESGIK